MRSFIFLVGAITIAAIAAFTVYMIDVEEVQEARLPNVTVEGGQLPKYNVETGKVEVTEKEVTVPDVDVKVTEKKVTVPGLEVTPPESSTE